MEVRYRNHNEKTNRFTSHSARSLIVIHPVDEVSVMQEIGQIALEVDLERQRTIVQE